MDNEDIEMQVENPEVFSKQLLEQLANAPVEGTLKRASAAGSNMIRRKLRENGFARNIVPHLPVSDEMLSYLPDTELPVVVEEMEPESPGARAISFNDSPDTAFYYADKFVVYFCKITTREFTKNVEELRKQRGDLRQVITDNALKDVQTEEDSRFIAEIDRLVGAVGGNGEGGIPQNVEINGAIARETYKLAIGKLQSRALNNGVFLVNRITGNEFLGLGRDAIGGDLSEKLFVDGLPALTESKVMGVRHIFTIKNDLVGDNEVYQFAEPGYLGRAYILSNVVMYVEKKRDILRFSAEEKLGFREGS